MLPLCLIFSLLPSKFFANVNLRLAVSAILCQNEAKLYEFVF